MAGIVAFHSFRRGTGKSTILANIAVLLAAGGRRVGIVDANLASAGLDILFGVKESEIAYTLNDYLSGACAIHETIIEVGGRLASSLQGQIFLSAASAAPQAIAKIRRFGYDIEKLEAGLHQLIAELELDVLLIESQAGLNAETLPIIASAEVLAVILRPDQQGYQGTGVMLEVARRLEITDVLLLINEIPTTHSTARVKAQIEQAYGYRHGGGAAL